MTEEFYLKMPGQHGILLIFEQFLMFVKKKLEDGPSKKSLWQVYFDFWKIRRIQHAMLFPKLAQPALSNNKSLCARSVIML